MGNGSTTEFSFNFPYYENTDIIVTKNNETVTDYTIIGTSGGENADIPYIGGKVVFDVAPTALDSIVIKRQLPLTRVVDYQPLVKLNPTTLNQDMNYMMEVMKDFNDELETFSTRYSELAESESTAVFLSRITTINQNVNEKSTAAGTSATNAALSATAAETAATNATTAASSANSLWNQFNGMRTNCITEIPQDIHLELNNGTLKLKTGSKAYKPNGSDVFDVINITSDLTYTNTSDGQYVLFVDEYSGTKYIGARAINKCVSGDTRSLTSAYMLWYDTSNNVINNYGADASTTVGSVSLPIAIITILNGAISSVDKIFNGFGYIGSTVFVLPGVKGLIPNGRNQDGTLISTLFTSNKVQTRTASVVGTDMILRMYSNGALFWSDATNNLYDSITNYNKSGIVIDNSCHIGKITTTTDGQITSFTTKNVFSYIV